MRNGGRFSGPRHPPTGHRGGGRGGHRQNFNRNHHPHHQQDHRRPQESYHHNGHGGGNNRPYHNGPPGRDPNWRGSEFDRRPQANRYENSQQYNRDREHQNRAPGGQRGSHPPEVATMNDQSRQDRPPPGAPGNGHTEPRRRDAPEEDVPQQPPTKRNKTEEDEVLSPEDREAKDVAKAREAQWNLLVDAWQKIKAATGQKDMIEIFNKLDLRAQAQILLPDALPRYNYPEIDYFGFSSHTWNLRKEKATAAAIVKAEALYPLDKTYDSDGCTVDSEESVGCPVGVHDIGKEARKFAESLRYCGPAIAGFLTPDLQFEGGGRSRSETEWCACPACLDSKNNNRPLMWKFWYMCGLPYHEHNSTVPKFKPAPFIKHIESKMEGGSKEGKLHSVLHVFLENFLEDFYKPGLPHYALLDGAQKKDEDGRKTNCDVVLEKVNKFRFERHQNQLKLLSRENQRILKLNEELEQEAKKSKKLKEVNEDLANKLQVKKDLLDEFEVKAERMPEMPFEICSKFLTTQVKLLRDRFFSIGEGKHDLDDRVTIQVDSSLSLNDLFESWYTTPKLDTGGFFAEFSKNTMSPVQLAKQWNVEYAVIELNMDDQMNEEMKGRNKKAKRRIAQKYQGIQDEHRDEYQALDDGGPSRQFLDSFCTQLEDLRVGKVKLFDAGINNVSPNTDTYVYSKAEEMSHKKIDKFYIAVGRLLLHVFLSHTGDVKKQDEDHSAASERFFVSDHILPGIYRKFLLQDIEPRNAEQYPIGTLVDDVVDALDCEYISNLKDPKEKKEKTMTLLFSTDIESQDFDTMEKTKKEAYFRKMAHETLIHERERVLKKIREGLELGGQVPLSSTLSLVPSAGIDQFFFATKDITFEDFFERNENGELTDEFSFVTHVDLGEDYIWKDKDKNSPYQWYFMNELLKKWIKTTKKENLVKFLFFSTGQSYIPDIEVHKDFKVLVEFNNELENEDHLPHAHTCVNTIKFPEGAYEGNLETLTNKLELAIAECSFGDA